MAIINGLKHGEELENEGLFDIDIDSNDNILLTGEYWNTVDFDPGAGTDNKTSSGNTDGFLVKYSSSGTYQWVKAWGGTDEDRPFIMIIDSSDNVYIGGKFRGTTDFDASAGTDNHSTIGNYDSSLTKYSSSGDTYEWTKTWGSSNFDTFDAIMVDSSDNIYPCGYFRDTVDFDPGAATENVTSAGITDMLLLKIQSIRDVPISCNVGRNIHRLGLWGNNRFSRKLLCCWKF